MEPNDLLQMNRPYARDFDKGDLGAEPALRVAILTCMDARMDVHRILGLSEGDAHVIRNAGGLVTDDAVRSLVLSQRVLETRDIVVIQHEGCGMIDLPEDEIREEIKEDAGIEPEFDFGAFSDLEQSVRSSVAALRDNPLLPHRNVSGFVYDVTTGALRQIV